MIMAARHARASRAACSAPCARAMAASSSSKADASTLSVVATAENLCVATWNVGMPSRESFATWGEERYATFMEKLSLLARTCHVIGLNEVHAAHHAKIDELLTKAASGSLSMLGSDFGEVVIWRPLYSSI